MRLIGAGIVVGSGIDALQLVGPTRVYAKVRIKTRAHEEERNVDSDSVFTLPFIASHVAVHWEGHHDALVRVAFDAGAGFAAASTVLHDEVGEQKNDGRTYGAVMIAGGASAVRIVTDRPLPGLRVLAMVDGERTVTYSTGAYPTGEDETGKGVTCAHAYQFNSGTVGIALLGTLTSQDTTAAGRNGIEQMLAWKASTHGIDPNGSNRYTNPVTRASTTFANIAGHRDVNATECPGGVFYQTLPTVRNDVAAAIGGTPSPSPTAVPCPTPTPKPTPKPKHSPSPTPSGGANH